MVWWNVESLLQDINCSYAIEGQQSKLIKTIASIDRGTENDVSFCSLDNYKGISTIMKSNSGLILCKKNMHGLVYPNTGKNQLLVFVENPRLIFTKIAKKIESPQRIKTGMSPRAVVSDSASIGKGCYIGDFTLVGDNCVIGDNTIVDSRVTLENCIIGKNCMIQPGTILGVDGFAFEREAIKDYDNVLTLEKFPHYGKVIMNDNVEVFANCSIARGSLSDTIIGYGTKIDALCHIAHNVIVGKNTELTAGTIIGGSTVIGNNCWLGLNSTVKNKVIIGNNAIIGCGRTVIHDVSDEDVVAGVPAKSIKHKINVDKDKLYLMAGQIRQR